MKKAWTKDHRPMAGKCICGLVSTFLAPKSRKKFSISHCSVCRRGVIVKPYLTVVVSRKEPLDVGLQVFTPTLTLVK